MDAMEVRKVGDVTIVRMPKSVDSNTAGDVGAQLSAIVRSGVKRLACDFTANSYVSSAGLRVFMETSNEIEEVQGRMAVFGMNEVVFEVFDITGFTDVFPIVRTEKDAIDDLKQG